MRTCKDDFTDMLRAYHGTGARTSELALAKVSQSSARARQILLGKHKRSRTMSKPTVRHINLSDEVKEILERRCAERPPAVSRPHREGARQRGAGHDHHRILAETVRARVQAFKHRRPNREKSAEVGRVPAAREVPAGLEEDQAEWVPAEEQLQHLAEGRECGAEPRETSSQRLSTSKRRQRRWPCTTPGRRKSWIKTAACG